MNHNKSKEEYISLLTNSGFFSKTDAELFCDKFEESSILSKNEHGHCIVVKAKRHGKWHAIKRLKKEYIEKPFFVNLLEKEFEIGYNLDHPNLVKTIGKEYDDNGMYIISEFIDGITLRDYINSNGTINLNLKRKFIIEIANALSYIHSKQVIHRDLKPENILITHNGSNIKLIDFGLSDADNYHVFKEAAGTKSYAAPEVLKNENNITFKADLYSLGKIILDLWSVEEKEVNQVEKPYNTIAKKCLEENPNERYSSANSIISDLTLTKQPKSKLYYLIPLIIIVVSSVLFLVYRNGIDDGNNNDLLTENKTIQDNQVSIDKPIVEDDNMPSTGQVNKIIVTRPANKDDRKQEDKHGIKTSLSREDSLLIEAKELIPNIMKDFYDKYKSIDITPQNDERIGTELGEIRSKKIPKAVATFKEKLIVGSEIELRCLKIIEDQERISIITTTKMFEGANEARGIPSPRKKAYMIKMYDIYSDSTYAYMKKGNVNEEKIKRFRDSTKKYSWLNRPENIKKIIVPDSFEWDYK